MTKKINTRILESFLGGIMLILATSAILMMIQGLRFPFLVTFETVIILILIILIITVLGLAYILVRIWEKHIVPYYIVEKKKKEK